MKKMKVFMGGLSAVLMILVLTACAAKEDRAYDYDTGNVKYGNSSSDGSTGFTTAPGAVAQEKPAYEKNKDMADFDQEEGAIRNTSTVTSNGQEVSPMEKIIRRVYMDVETQEFDSLIGAINDEIASLGGYVENSDISGKRYYNMNVMRRANIVARIPKERLNKFVDTVYENSNVVNKSESTENVTLQYVDTESRKKALEIEQERLFELLEKTDTLEEIIALESRLSTIRYDLQNYATQLRTYDNQVDYSTVTLSIEEVERMTPKVDEKVTVMSRIKNGLSKTLYDITEGFKDFVVSFTVNLPYIIFWAVIITVGIIITRRYYRKYKKNDLGSIDEQKSNHKDQTDDKN